MSNENEKNGNIIVNIANLKVLLNSHLIQCDLCNKSKLSLEHVQVSAVCQKLTLTCPTCKESNRSIKRRMIYLYKTIPDLRLVERKK